MSATAHYHALDAGRFEPDYLRLESPYDAARWADMARRPGYFPEEQEAAQEILERCIDACGLESWSARGSGSIRRTLGGGDLPAFASTGAPAAPLLDAWQLLQATIGAAPARTHALPYWLHLSYNPGDAYVGITPPDALDALVRALGATRLVDVSMPLLDRMQCDGYADDLRSLTAFLERVAPRRPWIIAYEWGS